MSQVLYRQHLFFSFSLKITFYGEFSALVFWGITTSILVLFFIFLLSFDFAYGRLKGRRHFVPNPFGQYGTQVVNVAYDQTGLVLARRHYPVRPSPVKHWQLIDCSMISSHWANDMQDNAPLPFSMMQSCARDVDLTCGDCLLCCVV